MKCREEIVVHKEFCMQRPFDPTVVHLKGCAREGGTGNLSGRTIRRTVKRENRREEKRREVRGKGNSFAVAGGLEEYVTKVYKS